MGLLILFQNYLLVVQTFTNIYQKIENLKSTFAKEQIDEEKFKARIIIKYPQIKESIFQLEDTDLLRGRVDFIFYGLNIDKTLDTINLDLLEEIKSVFLKNLSSDTCLN